MIDRCPTDVYYEFHGMEQRDYNPIEIARQYAPKFDKPVVDMVEVVRCKDCKHLNKEEMRCFEVEGLGYRNVANGDFCSRGVRKDEVEE